MGDLERIVNYILSWLCYEDEELAKRVAYTADEKALETYDVIIVPNGHLGKDIIVPELKRPEVEQPAKNKAIIRTDIVYNTFFFISRAEELVTPQRDEHGRFAAKYSILGQRSRMQIPRLDEYARTLLKALDAPLPEPGFKHIYLTHDVDAISQYRSLRGILGGIKRGEYKQVLAALKDIHNDPQYTFPWLVEQDKRLTSNSPKDGLTGEADLTSTIYFIKHTRGRGFDYPQYCLHGRDYKRLKHMLRYSDAFLGVHGSYYGYLPKIKYSRMYRAHYLRCSIEQMQRLADAGYTDDFTMGFADQAGFRLQTTRAVRWINPITFQLSPLTLHPLTIMDVTLSAPHYMNLTEDEAYFLCERLIDKVRLHHGDLCLLWHNSSIGPDTYHRTLYPKVLSLLQ